MQNRMSRRTTFAAAGIALISSSLILAERNAAPDSVPGAASPTAPAVPGATALSVDAASLKFVQEAASDGMVEVALGQLAQQKGSSDVVKQFGEHMVRDHTGANARLKDLAAQKRIDLPGTMLPAHQARADKLAALSGEQFDSEYMAAMIEDHTQSVEKFQRQSQTGADTEIRVFATEILPVMRAHLKMAQDIAGKQGVAGR